MGTRIVGAETVYAAAEAWVERGLRRDDSLFTSGEEMWTSVWLGELRQRFLDRPDESKGRSFLDKLERQLENSPPAAYQLMAEVLYVYFLIVHTSDSTAEQAQVDRVLGWSPDPVSIPPDLVAGLVPGLANPGQAFHTFRPYQVGVIIEFAAQWKQLPPDERQRLLEDPWAFKDFVLALRLSSNLLRENQNTGRIQRQALLHLAHPDTFESIVSLDHKDKIVSHFDGLIDDPSQDVDCNLQAIRSALEGVSVSKTFRGNRNFHFYHPEIRKQWDDTYEPDLWDEFIESAREYVGTGQLDIEENDYKIEIGQRVAEAREAALAQSSNWADLAKNSISSNLIFHVEIAKFRDWVDEAPAEALSALRAIWVDSDTSASERLQAFAELLPTSASGGVGVRTTLASVLLMGVEVREYPPFRVTLFKEAYRRTGYERPSEGADEAAQYDHALGFLDRFIDEASERDLNLRHHLDAQSAVWAVIMKDPSPELELEAAPSLAQLAEKLNLPASFLEEIESLLDDKRQVIFQGPPGTGKTFVAQELAQCLAGSDGRVTLIQFHPSYAYLSRYGTMAVSAIRESGWDPTMPLGEVPRGLLLERIVAMISGAERAVYEVGTENGNVWFEMGVSVALRQPTALMSDREPAALAGILRSPWLHHYSDGDGCLAALRGFLGLDAPDPHVLPPRAPGDPALVVVVGVGDRSRVLAAAIRATGRTVVSRRPSTIRSLRDAVELAESCGVLVGVRPDTEAWDGHDAIGTLTTLGAAFGSRREVIVAAGQAGRVPSDCEQLLVRGADDADLAANILALIGRPPLVLPPAGIARPRVAGALSRPLRTPVADALRNQGRALLSAEPGYGKTTLLDQVARELGYPRLVRARARPSPRCREPSQPRIATLPYGYRPIRHDREKLGHEATRPPRWSRQTASTPRHAAGGSWHKAGGP